MLCIVFLDAGLVLSQPRRVIRVCHQVTVSPRSPNRARHVRSNPSLGPARRGLCHLATGEAGAPRVRSGLSAAGRDDASAAWRRRAEPERRWAVSTRSGVGRMAGAEPTTRRRTGRGLRPKAPRRPAPCPLAYLAIYGSPVGVAGDAGASLGPSLGAARLRPKYPSSDERVYESGRVTRHAARQALPAPSQKFRPEKKKKEKKHVAWVLLFNSSVSIPAALPAPAPPCTHARWVRTARESTLYRVRV